MRLIAATLASLSLFGASLAHANQAQSTPSATSSDIGRVSPALEKYATHTIQEGLWKRPGLTLRDRSIVTVATLIARNQAGEMARHIALALDNGVKPAEISEIITHLAFYSSWGNAMSAVAAAEDVFTRRGIGADQLPVASPQLLPLNEATEAQRATGVQQNFGQVSPGVVQYTTDLLFKDLWLRPDLIPPRQESRHGQRLDCLRTGGPDSVSPEPGHG